MKTFAINLHFIAGTIERFVVTLVSLCKHVGSIFCTVLYRRNKKKKMYVSFFYGLTSFNAADICALINFI